MKLLNILKESIKYNVQFESADKQMIQKFVDFVKKELSIKEDIDVILQNDKNGIKTTAVYNYGGGQSSTIKVYCKDRQMVDILRSIAHEMTHHMQYETGKLEKKPADVGGPIEDEANAKAGEFIKKFAQMGNEIYPKGEEEVKEASSPQQQAAIAISKKQETNEQQDEEDNDTEFGTIKFLDTDKEGKKEFVDYIEDKRANFLYKKFVNKEIEFSYERLSGKIKIMSIGPEGANIGFAASADSFTFENETYVKVVADLKELRYDGENVPVKFYKYISRYLPPEDEEESYRGEPVEQAVHFGLKEVEKICKSLGLRFTKVELMNFMY